MNDDLCIAWVLDIVVAICVDFWNLVQRIPIYIASFKASKSFI